MTGAKWRPIACFLSWPLVRRSFLCRKCMAPTWNASPQAQRTESLPTRPRRPRWALACTVMVADCLPVLFTNRQGTLVAAAHAGWRGLVGSKGQGVLETVIDQFRASAPVHNAQAAIDIIAWLGPCIGPTAFEVGAEVREAFVAHDAAAGAMFLPSSPGKWLANLPGLARQRLRAQGVRAIYGNDGSEAWCTVNQPSRFFSYRRDGVSGRFAACIWLN